MASYNESGVTLTEVMKRGVLGAGGVEVDIWVLVQCCTVHIKPSALLLTVGERQQGKYCSLNRG